MFLGLATETSLVSCPRDSMTKAGHAGQDLVGRLRPDKRFGSRVGEGDVLPDCRFEGHGAPMRAAAVPRRSWGRFRRGPSRPSPSYLVSVAKPRKTNPAHHLASISAVRPRSPRRRERRQHRGDPRSHPRNILPRRRCGATAPEGLHAVPREMPAPRTRHRDCFC